MPIHLAAIRGNTRVMKLILEKMANIEHRDSFGQTALHYAVINDNIDTVRILIKREANPNHKNLNGKSAFDLCTNA